MSNVIDKYVEEEMKQCYLDYSMSVIVSRAIPDVRDGLKPVHRRILYAMNELGMTHDKPFKKCARIVGEVLGKYHPHGDSAVYGAMVRMAQDFNYRYEFVEGHGNFGSIDGDGAAAMRYTEARMAKITDEILADIDKDTIDFRKNFDDSLDEPVVLPAKIPSLLLNGTVGIAVGMATNIPPHNLGELVDGTLALIDNRDITSQELIDYIPGPDFPTGGIINGRKGIHDAYTKGRGKIQVRAKVKIEDISNGKHAIVVNEIPYQVNKSALIEKIALLVKEKKLTGISDLRDESDREGIRIVIELKKGEEPEIVLNKLYKYTDLQTSFGVIMLALVNNVPKVLNLKEVLEEYIKHRFEVITRRTKFELDKAEKRDHILQGFRIALENIDRIISLIKNSKDSNSAKESLIEKYAFSEIQARSIMDMKLQRLTGLEREKIEQEFQELERKIKEFKEILADDEKIYGIMKQELEEVKEKYNDDRRTVIEDERKDIDVEDLIKDEKVILTITNKGYVKRIGIDNYKAQRRGGRGVSSQNTIEDDFVSDMFVMLNLDTVLIFTDKGRVYKMKAYEVPETSKQSRGKLISNIINFQEDEKPAFIIKVREFSEEKEVIFVTKDGTIKKTNLMEYANINSNGKIAINFRDGDGLVFAGLIRKETDQLFIATKLGYSVRMDLNEVRSISRTAIGVKGITLREGDSVVSALLITSPDEETILTVTANGYGKRSRVIEYTTQKRGGMGIKNFRLTDKTGEIIGVKPVKEDEEIIAINSSGVVIRTAVNSIAVHGRATSGVIIMKTDDNSKVVAVVKVKNEKDEERILSEAEEETLETEKMSKKQEMEEIIEEDSLFQTFDSEEDEEI
ncbi:DNA gyrase subunit A [Fusobacterium sp.]|uniref:DNA gyrase subunit A n=1 Tax=Fusobacterium sp. TaxID=68766 RepID=UPI002615A715|nr:DNA gyrase subunit A [Fusobacterium sp.]